LFETKTRVRRKTSYRFLLLASQSPAQFVRARRIKILTLK
jgi:hypothetical protein